MPKPATFENPKVDLPASEDIARPYTDKELEVTPEMSAQLEKLMKFFDDHGINYSKFDKINTPKLNLEDRKAYPNYDQYMFMPNQHDIKKWLETVKTLYYKEKGGTGRVNAIRQATSGWKTTETYDFLNWLKFYEEGTHMKYKFAQVWYDNGSPGYFLHIKKDTPVEETHVSGKDMDSAKDADVQEMSSAERKSIIEKQRNKIVGRLDSAEKLLRTPEGQMFAGSELESLMETIFSLKKKVQLVNKLSTSTRLYEDMIIREANVLNRRGFYKAADVLRSVAQANNPPPPGTGTDKETPLTPVSPGDPAQPGNPGAPGGLPSMGPGMSQNAPTSATPGGVPNEMSPATPQVGEPAVEPTAPGISEFLNNMETSNLTDSGEVEDTLEVVDHEDELIVEAQMTPLVLDPNVPLTTNPGKPPAPIEEPVKETPATEIPLEVSEDDIPAPNDNAASPQASNFDSQVDDVFANIKISDVVAKLEDLAKIFKTREIPRQLAVVDMMLASLGLASYFDSLSEAQNKALDSNNYILTRVEDILSKLRGAMASKEIDLKGGEGSPEVSDIKNKLQQDQDKEKKRKQMRKDEESSELDGKTKETPQVEIAEDLAAPVAPPVPVAPPAARPTPVIAPPTR